MLVVADGSPFIALIQISQLEILPALFGEVIVPPQVLGELKTPNRPERVRSFAKFQPAWLVVQAPSAIESIPGLHAGETAAISLARELRAELLLIDEVKGRRAAIERGMRITGTIGVLELAAVQGLLDLAESFERLKKTDSWISRKLLDEALRLHYERGK